MKQRHHAGMSGRTHKDALGHVVLTLLMIIGAWLGAGTAQAASPGAVVSWGWNISGETTVPVAAQNGVIAIAAGEGHTMALKSDGSVLAWGANGAGQTTVPVAAQSGVIAIAAGASYTNYVNWLVEVKRRG